MTANVMLDTNLWVYLYAENTPTKQQVVKELLATHFSSVMLSTQILGELYHVLTRKKLTTTVVAADIVRQMATSFPVVEINTMKVLLALDIQSKYGYTYWDSLLLATNLLHGCHKLYSEDMQNQQFIEGKVQIINPFA
jgi:predicted nucleic acid-binding protein